MVLMGKKTQTVLVINCEKYDTKIALFRRALTIMQKETFEVCLLKKLRINNLFVIIF